MAYDQTQFEVDFARQLETVGEDAARAGAVGAAPPGVGALRCFVEEEAALRHGTGVSASLYREHAAGLVQRRERARERGTFRQMLRQARDLCDQGLASDRLPLPFSLFTGLVSVGLIAYYDPAPEEALLTAFLWSASIPMPRYAVPGFLAACVVAIAAVFVFLCVGANSLLLRLREGWALGQAKRAARREERVKEMETRYLRAAREEVTLKYQLAARLAGRPILTVEIEKELA